MENLIKKMISQIFGADLFSAAKDVLVQDPFVEYTAAASTLQTVYNMIVSAAMMLMFIYFLIGVIDKMTSENFSWEQLWKQFAMLLAAKLVVEHGLDIMRLMSGVGAELVTWISTKATPGADTALTEAQVETILSNLRGQFNLKGILKGLGDLLIVVELAIPWVVAWIMQICIKIVCYTRLIEIYVKACFAPFALSDFFKNGFQGGGWRYLKGFLAVCLQGAIILGITIFYSALSASVLPDDKTSFLAFIGVYFAVSISSIMLMFRSLSLSKEIMGVN